MLPEVVSQQALNELGRSLMASGIAVHPIRSAAVPEETARSTTERQHELGETLSSWSKAAGEVIAECASAAGKPCPQGLKARSTKNQNNLYRFIGPGFPDKGRIRCVSPPGVHQLRRSDGQKLRGNSRGCPVAHVQKNTQKVQGR